MRERIGRCGPAGQTLMSLVADLLYRRSVEEKQSNMIRQQSAHGPNNCNAQEKDDGTPYAVGALESLVEGFVG